MAEWARGAGVSPRAGTKGAEQKTSGPVATCCTVQMLPPAGRRGHCSRPRPSLPRAPRGKALSLPPPFPRGGPAGHLPARRGATPTCTLGAGGRDQGSERPAQKNTHGHELGAATAGELTAGAHTRTRRRWLGTPGPGPMLERLRALETDCPLLCASVSPFKPVGRLGEWWQGPCLARARARGDGSVSGCGLREAQRLLPGSVLQMGKLSLSAIKGTAQAHGVRSPGGVGQAGGSHHAFL